MFQDCSLMNKLGVAASLECNIFMIESHKFNAGMPSMRELAPSEIVSDSVLAVCFLQAHEIGTNVCDPNVHRTRHLRLTLCPSNFLQYWRFGRRPVCSDLVDSQYDNNVCRWM